MTEIHNSSSKKIKYPNNSLKRCTVSRILWKTPFDYELIFIDSMFMSGFGNNIVLDIA